MPDLIKGKEPRPISRASEIAATVLFGQVFGSGVKKSFAGQGYPAPDCFVTTGA